MGPEREEEASSSWHAVTPLIIELLSAHHTGNNPSGGTGCYVLVRWPAVHLNEV